MFIIAALLVAAAVAMGFYGHQNPGSHDVNFLGFQWTGVYDWVPVAVAAGAVALICVIGLIYAAVRLRILGSANARLLMEIDTLRAVPVATPAAVTPTGRLVSEREATGRRLGWFGRGSRKQRTLARQHATAQHPDHVEGAPQRGDDQNQERTAAPDV